MKLAKLSDHAQEDRPLFLHYQGKVLAFDQTLANTGMVGVNLNPEPTVLFAMTLRCTYALEGNAAVLRRAEDLHEQLFKVLTLPDAPRYDRVLYEMPAARNSVQRPESSLLAALALRLAANGVRMPCSDVSANRAKKILTGNGNAKKTEVREVVAKMYPDIYSKWLTNEHLRDAFAVALAFSHDYTPRT